METRLIGKIISRRFRVEDIIGRGGMAIVYRAFDLKTHQTVAIKVLREEYADDPEYRERFRREGEVCRKLSHPNVVNLIDAGEVGDVSYLAMEYVDGQTLKELITQTGGIAQEDAVRFTLQILAALGHAHQRGIIHRDVKPQNVMVSRAGQVKVGDFGIAGMGTTLSMMWRGGGYMYIAHVGDSRIYRLRDGRMEQITQDHSLVGELVRAGILTPEEARTHPRRNIITRALGTEGDNTPDLLAADIKPGDRFLLCTDGLTVTATDAEICRAVCVEKRVEDSLDHLIALAKAQGAPDNVTAVLINYE